jgi:hypothetical protein
VSRATVAERLGVILKENEPDAAKRARATLSAIFGWLIGNGRAEPDPVVGTIETAQEEKRCRVARARRDQGCVEGLSG